MIHIDIDEVRVAADFIRSKMTGHFVSYDPFRFCLEIFHRVLFKSMLITSPSLEIGIGDGFSSWFMHRGKPNIDYGSDMPFGATLESCGMYVPMKFDHFNRMVAMDMTSIPFPDQSFATIFSSHTMMYGQDLQSTFREIMRVLAPGGSCAFCVDVDTWYKHKTLLGWLTDQMPSAQFFPKEHFLHLIEQEGAIEISYRTFFQSSLEAVLVGLSAALPTEMKSALSEEIYNDGSIARTIAVISNVLTDIIENELALPDGPQDAFNVFVTFKKPGKLPLNLEVADPVCPACHNNVIDVSPIKKTCMGCNESYLVQAGVPIMINPNHLGYSPTQNRQISEMISSITDIIVNNIAATMQADNFIVINDGSSPVPFNTTTNILFAAMNYQSKSVSGIYDPQLIPGTTWRGITVLGTDELMDRSKNFLVMAEEREWNNLVNKIMCSGINGTLWGILWSNKNGMLDAHLSMVKI